MNKIDTIQAFIDTEIAAIKEASSSLLDSETAQDIRHYKEQLKQHNSNLSRLNNRLDKAKQLEFEME